MMTAITQSNEAMATKPDTNSYAQQQKRWLKQVAEHQDKAAFGHLFRYFAPRLLNHARQHFNNDAQAEELVQETMTKLWLKAHLYQHDKGQVSTWLFTIARNVRFDMLRRMQARPEQLQADDLYLEQEPQAELSPAVPLDGGILRQQLLRYCQQLPPTQQQVMQMIYFEDCSQQEVADALEIPLGTVKSRLRLALVKIRELLDA